MMRFTAALAACAALLALGTAAAQAPSRPQATAPKTSFVIYASTGSRKLLAFDDLRQRVNRWRDLLKERGSSYVIVTHPQQLAQVPAGTAIILPSAVVLEDEERKLILERIAAGDRLLATWMPGTLDASGAAIPAAFVEQAFGIPAKPIATGERSFLITTGDTPLTYALPAGTRVWMEKNKRPTPLLKATGAGYLSDWSRAAGDTGLIAYATVGASRRALLGWGEDAWGQLPEYRKIAALALDWVEGKPVAYRRTWPWPYRAAMTIGVDSLWRFENVPRLAELLSRSGVHGSFHFLPPDSDKTAAIIRDLVRAGHSVGGFGDATQPFASQPDAQQAQRVNRMVASFKASVGPDFTPAGLRAPQGATDEGTEKATASLSYLVDVGRVDSPVPLLSGNRHLALISASANFGANASLEELGPGLAEAAARARLLGGYAFVGVDVAGFQRDSALETALTKFLDSRAKDLWLASVAEVAAWWRESAQLKISSAWDAADSMLTIDIGAPEATRSTLAMAVATPPGKKTIRIEEAVAGAQIQVDADGTQTLVLEPLAAGTHRVRLRFLP